MTTASPVSRISLQIVVSTRSSPPGWRPKAISSRTAHRANDPAILDHARYRGEAETRRAAPASRIIGITSILATAARSSAKLFLTMVPWRQAMGRFHELQDVAIGGVGL